MNLDHYIKLWNQASIQVMDVQHHVLTAKQLSLPYYVPENGFLYTVRGNALITINDNTYTTERFHMIHSGKESIFQIEVYDELLEYYLILYRPQLFTFNSSARSLLEHHSVLDTAYELKPHHPILLHDKIKQLHQAWTYVHPLQQLQVRTSFLQIVYDILEQLQTVGHQHTTTDLVSQAIRYIHEHYELPLTIDSLATILECSPRHLARLFRNSDIGQSPSDYLIQFRMQKASELLIQTELTLQDIAINVGYQDGYYFSRMFKKYMGLSPIRYRQQHRQNVQSLNMTSTMSDFSIVGLDGHRYSDNDSQNIIVSGGSLMMHNPIRRSAVLMLLLSFTLLLGACSAPASSTSQTASSKQSASEENATQSSTRTITHDLGSTEVPDQPKRIVVLEQGFTQTVAELQVKPVGVADDNKPERFPQDTLAYIEGYTSVGTRSEPNLEVIRTLEPDLIIADTSRHSNVYEELSAIAPTIVFKNDTANYSDIMNSTQAIGEALGKVDETTAMLAEHQQQLDNVKQSINSNQSVLIIAADEEASNSFQVRTDQAFHASFLQALGLNYALTDAEEVSQLMTTEQLLAIDPDQLLILINEDDPSVLAGQKDNLLWNQLKAVQTGKAHEVELAKWSRQRSIPALNHIMSEATTYFK
ncbi:iron complex transport system substrate-binding protein [Paenibacillus sp. SORGH_AS306]|uniref:AraC family transcriptional regulator n=1 Tax=unclassified Paenibacillus TaxID=185978 RepID=UPI002787DDBA|nr:MULTISPECIES: ABC transporter substrate-binding protein [unclassified Paenibacillus]MDQ1232576.1 iron complex transport system substrate-binding protein [Paenibacillus sp. SORGH_AS_0306]MDR6109627.1 iron complex transport system substrate-binding protein [Paenibacillus sp. SORGH_AS_0338]